MSVRDNYTMINIREYLALGTDEEVGEPALVRMLSDFSCPKNPDVEYFLKKNAIEFTKKNQSVTYLVFSNDEGELIGYFSIALKPLTVRCETVSNTVSLIGALLSSELKEQEKLDIIKHEYNIQISSEFREDVSVMGNLSQGIVDDTKAEIIMNMYRKGYTLEQIADVTEKSISEIGEIIKKEPAMA